MVTDAVVTWDALCGQSYTLQWSTDLANWTAVNVGQTNTWTDAGAFSGAPKRFYRVMK